MWYYYCIQRCLQRRLIKINRMFFIISINSIYIFISNKTLVTRSCLINIMSSHWWLNISRACLTSMHKTNAAVVIDTKRWVIRTNLASFKAHIAFVIRSNDFRHYLYWTLYNALSSLADGNKQIFVDVVLFIVLPVQTGKVFASLGPSVGFIVQIVLLIAIVFRERAALNSPSSHITPFLRRPQGFTNGLLATTMRFVLDAVTAATTIGSRFYKPQPTTHITWCDTILEVLH